MTKNNTNVYEMYLNGIHQATGSIRMLAEHIGKSRKTVDGMIHQGNNKNYSFKRIGKYAQIYALYNKDVFVMNGTLDELSAATGMQMKQLEWFRTPSAEKRGGTYQVVKLEGEFEVVREAELKWKEKVYEVQRKHEIYTGTPEQIGEQLNVRKGYASNFGAHIGTRWARLKAVDLETLDTFYGNRDEVAAFTGLTNSRVMKIVRESDGKSPHFEITFTGKYDVELFGADKPKIQKPTAGHIDIKPVYTHKPVPMSRYAKELFEWSTKHLRRDA